MLGLESEEQGCRSGGMVDAKVLKTFGLVPCGFESRLRHQMRGRRCAIESEELDCPSGGMVDAKVSKTFGLGPCGFDSHLRHQLSLVVML